MTQNDGAGHKKLVYTRKLIKKRPAHALAGEPSIATLKVLKPQLSVS